MSGSAGKQAAAINVRSRARDANTAKSSAKSAAKSSKMFLDEKSTEPPPVAFSISVSLPGTVAPPSPLPSHAPSNTQTDAQPRPAFEQTSLDTTPRSPDGEVSVMVSRDPLPVFVASELASPIREASSPMPASPLPVSDSAPAPAGNEVKEQKRELKVRRHSSRDKDRDKDKDKGHRRTKSRGSRDGKDKEKDKKSKKPKFSFTRGEVYGQEDPFSRIVHKYLYARVVNDDKSLIPVEEQEVFQPSALHCVTHQPLLSGAMYMCRHDHYF